MKRFLAVFLMLAILLTGLTVTANAATTGWKKLDDGTWTYVKADGKLAENEWIQDGKTWYYFDGTTMVADGYMEIKGKWYGFSKTGAMVADSWYEVKDAWTNGASDWYYAGSDGAFVKGWKKIDGKWYFFANYKNYAEADPWMYQDTARAIDKGYADVDYSEKTPIYVFTKSGDMVESGWHKVTWHGDGYTWYYVKNGEAAKGWVKDGGKWYYLDAEYGFMYDEDWGLVEMNDKNIYTFDKSGAMVTGWKKIDGVWYYFKDSGAMLKSDWVKGSDGKWYYLKEDGKMAVSETITWKGKEYKFDANGAWIEK